jgi:hypothetical protein
MNRVRKAMAKKKRKKFACSMSYRRRCEDVGEFIAE